jgi:CDP-diacylglycerol--glycerol-3-phosphate 3-phosphatidyltransferase
LFKSLLNPVAGQGVYPEMAVSGPSKTMQNLPNILTLCRIFVVPILVILLCFPNPLTRALATLLFVIASTTDYLDGYLARKYNVISTMGKLLDPMADKLLVMAVLIMLVPSKVGAVPAWIVVVILSRDIMITSLRGVASARGVVIQAEELGKIKTVLQIFALTGLILHYPYFSIDFHAGGMYFLWASLILSIWSGVSYFQKFWASAIREPKKTGQDPTFGREAHAGTEE